MEATLLWKVVVSANHTIITSKYVIQIGKECAIGTVSLELNIITALSWWTHWRLRQQSLRNEVRHRMDLTYWFTSWVIYVVLWCCMFSVHLDGRVEHIMWASSWQLRVLKLLNWWARTALKTVGWTIKKWIMTMNTIAFCSNDIYQHIFNTRRNKVYGFVYVPLQSRPWWGFH